MKKEYIAPAIEIISLNLYGSVLEKTVGVINGSPHGIWEDAAAKSYPMNNEPLEETRPDSLVTRKSLWDD
jgi:hypothetical protein